MARHTGGVYAISNRENGKTYIGRTQSFKTRWASHKAALIRGDHVNREMQADWDSYGPNAFSFGEVFECYGLEADYFERDAIRAEWLAGTAYNEVDLGVPDSEEFTLRGLRIQFGYTRNEVAMEVGSTEGSVFSWEVGRAIPRPHFLARLADLFNVSMDAIDLKPWDEKQQRH